MVKRSKMQADGQCSSPPIRKRFLYAVYSDWVQKFVTWFEIGCTHLLQVQKLVVTYIFYRGDGDSRDGGKDQLGVQHDLRSVKQEEHKFWKDLLHVCLEPDLDAFSSEEILKGEH